MKIVEFETTRTDNGQIAIPAEIASQLPKGEPVRVVLQWGEQDDESDWLANARARFEAAYSPEDAVYERLMDEA